MKVKGTKVSNFGLVVFCFAFSLWHFSTIAPQNPFQPCLRSLELQREKRTTYFDWIFPFFLEFFFGGFEEFLDCIRKSSNKEKGTMKKCLVFTVFKCLLHSVVFKVLVLLSPPTAVLLADAELLEVSPEILCRNFLPFSLKDRLIVNWLNWSVSVRTSCVFCSEGTKHLLQLLLLLSFFPQILLSLPGQLKQVGVKLRLSTHLYFSLPLLLSQPQESQLFRAHFIQKI